MAGDENQPLKSTARLSDTEENHLTRLPDDVLADIIGRVSPRQLAVSRCVCKAWHDTIDAHGLLRADLLPLRFAGLFIHFNEHKYPEFFARPSSGDGSRAVSGNLSFLPSPAPHAGTIWDKCVDFCDYDIEDHCNGLLLLRNFYVVNPATRRWNSYPPCPAEDCTGIVWHSEHLVYDPMVSPHYQLLMIPCVEDTRHLGDQKDLWIEESEWPSPCKIYVFSSRSGCWEEKYLVRQGDAAARTFVAERRVDWLNFTKNAVYFRRALYIYCGAALFMRISLSDNAYHVIKPPVGINVEDYLHINIVRSEKGVYFAALDVKKCWLRVWILNESCGQMEWMLKHDKDLKPVLACHRFHRGIHGHWILEDINYKLFRSTHSTNDMKVGTNEKIYEWNSDNDDDEDCHHKESCNEEYDIQILGFHPHKEIVFMSESQETGLAYHLNGSKIEVLGNIYPKDYERFKELVNEKEWITSYPYTPCRIEEFPQNN